MEFSQLRCERHDPAVGLSLTEGGSGVTLTRVQPAFALALKSGIKRRHIMPRSVDERPFDGCDTSSCGGHELLSGRPKRSRAQLELRLHPGQLSRDRV